MSVSCRSGLGLVADRDFVILEEDARVGDDEREVRLVDRLQPEEVVLLSGLDQGERVWSGKPSSPLRNVMTRSSSTESLPKRVVSISMRTPFLSAHAACRNAGVGGTSRAASSADSACTGALRPQSPLTITCAAAPPLRAHGSRLVPSAAARREHRVAAGDPADYRSTGPARDFAALAAPHSMLWQASDPQRRLAASPTPAIARYLRLPALFPRPAMLIAFSTHHNRHPHSTYEHSAVPPQVHYPRKSISDRFSIFAVVCRLACSAVCSVWKRVIASVKSVSCSVREQRLRREVLVVQPVLPRLQLLHPRAGFAAHAHDAVVVGLEPLGGRGDARLVVVLQRIAQLAAGCAKTPGRVDRVDVRASDQRSAAAARQAEVLAARREVASTDAERARAAGGVGQDDAVAGGREATPSPRAPPCGGVDRVDHVLDGVRRVLRST